MKFLQKNLQLFLIAGLLIAGNLILSSFFVRIDLTQEKRYSLADITLQTAEELEVPMTITVYLEGDFPPNIREFQEAIRTTLLEIKQYAGSDFAFNFVDPSKSPELLEVFRERGFAPIPVKVRLSTTETKEQYMWPILVLRYRDRDLYVDLLKGTAVMTPQGPNVNFAKAESDLEYKITSAMRSISRERGGLVALLQGHGEVPVEDLSGLGTAISNQYTVGQLNLSQVPNYEISPSIDVLVVLQPTRPFSERDKYEIDQYLMRGGSILWVLDLQEVNLNLYRNQSTLTQLRELNLDDMFMNYGFKLNYDLIQDLECEATEVFQPESRSFASKKWIFSPLALQFPEHPIARNVDAALMRYTSSIDTFPQSGVRKSVFMTSSRYSRTVEGSRFIDLNQYLQNPPPNRLFNRGPFITGLLAEGIFKSLFVGRRAPVDSLAPNQPNAMFGPQNNPEAPGTMAVISDGEFMLGKNFREERSPRLPYDNLTILMNAIDYLAGDPTLSQIRSKDVVVRRLDREKVVDNQAWIRVLNLGLPILAVVLFGLFRGLIRRRKNERLRVS